MSITAHTPRTSFKSNRIGMILTALVTLAATAAAVLLITLPGGGASHAASHGATATYAPLIQYRGTGAAPQTAARITGPAYVRAEHSYGMVP
jgi:hypothetical protein